MWLNDIPIKSFSLCAQKFFFLSYTGRVITPGLSLILTKIKDFFFLDFRHKKFKYDKKNSKIFLNRGKKIHKTKSF